MAYCGYILTNVDSDHGRLGMKVLDIGDWDMDANETVTVAHGLTLSNILNITAMIRNDDHTQISNLAGDPSEADTVLSVKADSSNVTLGRIGSGLFDNTEHNATSYNRGWITILYTA